MWAMEYNPNTFLLYETSAAHATSADLSEKMLRKYGKFERNNVKTGCKNYQGALAVFLAASILENKQKRILKEAKGLDDIVQVSPPHPPSLSLCAVSGTSASKAPLGLAFDYYCFLSETC